MRQLEELFRAATYGQIAGSRPHDQGAGMEWPEDPIEPPNDGQDGNVGDVNGLAGQDDHDDDEEEDRDFPAQNTAPAADDAALL
jgi:hypothetical protein